MLGRYALTMLPFLMAPDGDGGGGGNDGKTFTKADVDKAVTKAIAEAGLDVGGLKAKNTELLDKLTKIKPILDVIGETTPDELGELLTTGRATKDKKLKDSGEFEKLKDQLVTEHSKEKKKLEDRVSVLTASLFDVLAEQELGRVLASEEIAGDPLLLTPHMRPFIKVQEDDKAASPRQRFRATVVDAAGNPRVKDGQGTPFSIKDLAEEFRGKNEFGKAFGAGKGSGSGAQTEQRPGTVKAHEISWDDAQDVPKYRAAEEAAKKAGAELVIRPRS